MKTATHFTRGLPKKYGIFYTPLMPILTYTTEILRNTKKIYLGTLLDLLETKRNKEKHAQHHFKMEGPGFVQRFQYHQTIKYGIILYFVATIAAIPTGICNSSYLTPTYEYQALTPTFQSELQAASLDLIQFPNSEAAAQAKIRQARLLAQQLNAPPFHSHIQRAAQAYEVDIALIRAIIMAESSNNPRAVSYRGAQGLMQLMPRTAKWLGVKDAFDPALNIDGGVRYFRSLLDRFDGDIKLALAAYNAGSRYVRKYGGVPPFKATRIYIRKVLKYRQMYQKEMALTNTNITMS